VGCGQGAQVIEPDGMDVFKRRLAGVTRRVHLPPRP
jgi:hypothetical protein